MTRKVSGEATVAFTVWLPEKLAHKSVLCEDPAVEAVLETLATEAQIFIWGEDEEPARVVAELFEEDVNIEDDEE